VASVGKRRRQHNNRSEIAEPQRMTTNNSGVSDARLRRRMGGRTPTIDRVAPIDAAASTEAHRNAR
jgi:hypothetical protein